MKMCNKDDRGTVTVIVVETNGCLVHEVGQTWVMPPGDIEARDSFSTQVCPMALNSLYPSTYFMRFNAKIPWCKKWERGDSYRVCCPDEENRVVFEIRSTLT
jgi:uncharacterized repeat protein (TIGR04076 family)